MNTGRSAHAKPKYDVTYLNFTQLKHLSMQSANTLQLFIKQT